MSGDSIYLAPGVYYHDAIQRVNSSINIIGQGVRPNDTLLIALPSATLPVILVGGSSSPLLDAVLVKNVAISCSSFRAGDFCAFQVGSEMGSLVLDHVLFDCRGPYAGTQIYQAFNVTLLNSTFTVRSARSSPHRVYAAESLTQALYRMEFPPLGLPILQLGASQSSLRQRTVRSRCTWTTPPPLFSIPI